MGFIGLLEVSYRVYTGALIIRKVLWGMFQDIHTKQPQRIVRLPIHASILHAVSSSFSKPP